MRTTPIGCEPELAGASLFFTASDGLRLHARAYGEADSRKLVVACLPGLARTAADFDLLARRLSRSGRRVLALDYRGRGRSDRDPDWRRYDLATERTDILAVFAALGIENAALVGTSRGGLHAMGLAAVRPDLVAAAVLNDIGPVLETAGLQRIRGYVGRLPPLKSWPQAIAYFRAQLARDFPALGEEEIEAYARLTIEDEDGALVPRYDLALRRGLDALDLDAPTPDLWPQFDALAAKPLLVIRGANSDLLSAATLAAMAARSANCQTWIVPGQGHAPMLRDAPTIARIEQFLAAVDKSERPG